MQNLGDVSFVIVVCIIVTSFVILADRFLMKKDFGYQDPCDKKIEALRKEIKIEYDKKLEDARKNHEREVKELMDKIEILWNEILKSRITQTTEINSNNAKVLLACSGVQRFCATDTRVLRRAHVDFITLVDATPASISREIRRALQDNTPYTGIHISAHGDGDTIELGGENVTPEDLELAITSVDLVVLSSCKSHDIADKLTSRGRSIVTFLIDIEDEDAEETMYVFWRGIIAGETPRSAYDSVRKAFPQIADKIGFRGGRR